jgi:hypothetical protein
MGKKKSNGGGNNKPHANKSFEQYVADATLAKFGEYIDAQVQQVGQAMARHQVSQLAGILMQIKAIETVLEEKLGVTRAEIATKVAIHEDAAEGFVEVTEGGVALGDRLRLAISHKKSEDAEFSPVTRLMVNAIGAGQSLGDELENAVLGLEKNETREVVFGPEGSMTAKITIDRISRRPKPPVTTPAPEPVAPTGDQAQTA